MEILPLKFWLVAAGTGIFGATVRLVWLINYKSEISLCFSKKSLYVFFSAIFISILIMHATVEASWVNPRLVVPAMMLGGFCSIELVALLQKAFMGKVKKLIKEGWNDDNK